MENTHTSVSLIPGGCPQFLDFKLNIADLPRLRRYFREDKKQDSSAENSGRYQHFLRCLDQDADNFVDQITGTICDSEYEMDIRRVLEIWQDAWIPLPFLRTREQKWPDGGERFECGPSNWVRARLTSCDDDTLHLTLAFDTNVENPPEQQENNANGEHYHALSARDVSAHGMFALAHHVRDNAWFLNAPWVDEWLLNIYDEYRSKRHRGRGSWRDDNEHVLEHLAAYLTWLEVIRIAIQSLRVQVINPVRDQPVEVDLILDIGNSRTTGILVETLPQRVTNLNDSYLLELRDISKPEFIYSDPFETRIEFTEAHFGNDALSRRSGRRMPAFAWPSAVRIGPEAARLATHTVCAEGNTGMSSPKRYLWDERPWQQTWRFNTGGSREPMVTRGLFARQVNREGTPLACFDEPLFKRSPTLKKQEREPAFESLFTRSSLMLFMVGEIISQALVTINAPATRAKRELPNMPRRLRRIIFTVPTAMPVAERRIFRRWVTWAVRVVWEALGWSEWYVGVKGKQQSTISDYRTSPQVRCDWDEASCSQLVYIYNELAVKYHGDAHHLFELLGKPRASYNNKPCMRIASIDTGGGTMDLSIASYELSSTKSETARITPHMEFRDGFNIAGDEVLRDMISQHIIHDLSNALNKAGVIQPRTIIEQLVGRDAIGISKEARNLRARFVRQVAVPLALGMLNLCEILYQNSRNDTYNPSAIFTCKIRDFFVKKPSPEHDDNTEESVFPFLEGINIPANFFHPLPQAQVVTAVEESVQKHLASGEAFSLLDVELRINPSAIDHTIRTTLGPALATLCEVVNTYDCDILLLTGRPSAWSGIVAPVLAKLPVPPDRIIPMREYHVGNWYPFADAHGCITDPKTTVVVGAILCALAEGHLESFSFDVNKLRLSSTARYVGELDTTGKLLKPKVWFEVDVKSSEAIELEHTVTFSTLLPIGYRQIDAERWPTTRYHLLDFSSEDARTRAAGRTPYQVDIRLYVAPLDDDIHKADDDRDEGDFYIENIMDNQGNNVKASDLEIRLQTMQIDEGYWLDTGIISMT